MNTRVIIHCDKCNSTDVLHEEMPVVLPEEHKTMTQIANNSKNMSMTHDVYYYTNYRMICKSCGHIVKYQK